MGFLSPRRAFLQAENLSSRARAQRLSVLSTESRWARILLEKFSNWRKARRGNKNPT